MSALDRATKQIAHAHDAIAENRWCRGGTRSHHSTTERFAKRLTHRAMRRLGRAVIEEDREP